MLYSKQPKSTADSKVKCCYSPWNFFKVAKSYNLQSVSTPNGNSMPFHNQYHDKALTIRPVIQCLSASRHTIFTALWTVNVYLRDRFFLIPYLSPHNHSTLALTNSQTQNEHNSSTTCYRTHTSHLSTNYCYLLLHTVTIDSYQLITTTAHASNT